MTNRAIIDEYNDWLLEIIGFNLPEHRKYELLIKELNKVPFRWVIPMDENRDIDAFCMRKEFLFDNGYDVSSVWHESRTVLEVLIAFSRRIETDITGEPGKDDFGRWFWVMLDNLELLDFENVWFDKKAVDRILNIWLDRKFKKNGIGSIFPTTKVTSDQRDVEMWYQMQGYIDEHWEL